MMQRSRHEIARLERAAFGAYPLGFTAFVAAGRRFGAGHDHFPPPAGALTVTYRTGNTCLLQCRKKEFWMIPEDMAAHSGAAAPIPLRLNPLRALT
ncbi:MAG: hypothetical protein ACSLFL_07790 [Alphaproteobacteria bacterium]